MIIWNVTQHALTITAFVTMMMLAIEYLNVLTGGSWMQKLSAGRWSQYILGAFLGATPGCLGAFAMVNLYTHRRVSLGALVTTMIATSGDEAFLMLAMFPQTAVLIMIGLAVIGVIAGWMTDTVLSHKRSFKETDCGFHTHKEEQKRINTPGRSLREQWKHPTAVRGILTGAILIFIVFFVSSQIESLLQGHEHRHAGNMWEPATLMILLLLGLFIVATVSDHFLDEHLWKHVLKAHVPQIFAWVLGALTVIALLEQFIEVETLIRDNLWLVMLLAVGVGLIPSSGPHMIFVTLFASGALPLSVLVASSAVQDGHGMVPLLAHSKRDFFAIKLVNVIFGFTIGATMLLLNY